jgi:hypothetical protein
MPAELTSPSAAIRERVADFFARYSWGALLLLEN